MIPSEPFAFDFERLFNFRLWKLSALAGAPVIRLCEGRYGVTRREWRLLAALARDGASSPSALADRCSLDRVRTSRAIGSLVAKGLIERAVAANDPRRATVRLSASGNALVQEIAPIIADINARVLAALDGAQQELLDEFLTRLTDVAAQVNQELATDVRATRHAGGARRVWQAVETRKATGR